MRVVLKGIHKVIRHLANGETKVHFYAWRGGPAIHAKLGTPEFVHAYNEAHKSICEVRTNMRKGFNRGSFGTPWPAIDRPCAKS